MIPDKEVMVVGPCVRLLPSNPAEAPSLHPAQEGRENTGGGQVVGQDVRDKGAGVEDREGAAVGEPGDRVHLRVG
eukprot:CAMPEP_0194267588 /NCGR_PEP_ID=MMETSP0169-20130528/2068_1 /TAXON_ID=218684 /ORGANISM="Corethron pennatum, Strain L29A3" /LENGTH=74 /DNA_ID=CAMNT_0039008479 /DNA_START=210 /DNA_END=431 /DNA_ORIENTATION=-